ncbi:hypothetical protein LA303_08950 [Candidatus Sulfidibacterium hydrothermale]|uniref:hypothetical protein n=1 Tax=Candidatus Sulfidibacterium hydrothermale TaxID=2875962 RepID=UPI001F0ABE8D|nr:hypothetical protein [Candidatus Sulfidibacterium hydrothermale]UBM61327.1 hypothetical protein LA303_07805 [Candidatus Sulfidibacterium hydrothermale]UBM61543.1 hypothetical protein LA303_08950 [Candidatus Sulfidibacterium hydrothermale]
MDKEIFKNSFIENLNKNFPELSKNFDFKLKVFSELNTILFEINKCLLLEFNRAAITLTNNLIERLLKLALIYQEVGIGSKPVEKWTEIFSEPNKKYGQLKLGNSIELCKKNKLITEEEKQILFNHIRVLMRNGFAHADSSEILADLPDNSIGFQASLSNPTDIKEVRMDYKVIPFMQELQMENFANENSRPYFKFVFRLIFKIEKRLIENN